MKSYKSFRLFLGQNFDLIVDLARLMELSENVWLGSLGMSYFHGTNPCYEQSTV
jgi:hypothetical protein